jgi:hypothetical protein
MSVITKLLKEHSIYIILSLRGAEPGFHWSFFIPTDKPHGEVWHATNRTGGWFMETKSTPGVPNSISVCVALKLGTFTNENWVTLRSTLSNVPSSGQPSLNTGEAFTCRVWVKDAILALHNASVINLTKPIEEIEKDALAQGEDNRKPIEEGTGPAIVENDTGFSTTA